ncbi:hypothetical protein ABE288_05830 [Bacillus salipaludis]
MRVESAQEIQYQRYQTEITNAKVPFEVLSQTNPLTSVQQKMLTIVASR